MEPQKPECTLSNDRVLKSRIFNLHDAAILDGKSSDAREVFIEESTLPSSSYRVWPVSPDVAGDRGPIMPSSQKGKKR